MSQFEDAELWGPEKREISADGMASTRPGGVSRIQKMVEGANCGERNMMMITVGLLNRLLLIGRHFYMGLGKYMVWAQGKKRETFSLPT